MSSFFATVNKNKCDEFGNYISLEPGVYKGTLVGVERVSSDKSQAIMFRLKFEEEETGNALSYTLVEKSKIGKMLPGFAEQVYAMLIKFGLNEQEIQKFDMPMKPGVNGDWEKLIKAGKQVWLHYGKKNVIDEYNNVIQVYNLYDTRVNLISGKILVPSSTIPVLSRTRTIIPSPVTEDAWEDDEPLVLTKARKDKQLIILIFFLFAFTF
jgi:hypothetical protein